MKGLIYETSVESKKDLVAQIMAAADLGLPSIGDCVYQNMARRCRAMFEQVDIFCIPNCDKCGGVLKPDIVFFGENVPMTRVELVKEHVRFCDSVLVLGSSLSVFSGYRIVLQAKELNRPIAIVNIGETRGDKLCSFKLSVRKLQYEEDLLLRKLVTLILMIYSSALDPCAGQLSGYMIILAGGYARHCRRYRSGSLHDRDPRGCDSQKSITEPVALQCLRPCVTEQSTRRIVPLALHASLREILCMKFTADTDQKCASHGHKSRRKPASHDLDAHVSTRKNTIFHDFLTVPQKDLIITVFSQLQCSLQQDSTVICWKTFPYHEGKRNKILRKTRRWGKGVELRQTDKSALHTVMSPTASLLYTISLHVFQLLKLQFFMECFCDFLTVPQKDLIIPVFSQLPCSLQPFEVRNLNTRIEQSAEFTGDYLQIKLLKVSVTSIQFKEINISSCETAIDVTYRCLLNDTLYSIA
ncbi:hypothetical protein PR048_009979 [Dryococelus australis]|uniref:Deacetylase sirtuin-type domain-containing protein n=1 Tax=Dryococelus australis TaxID=614101 RepID=A0ABQ9I2H4_9NEOP|nr:hypothetical protein PR048_009979 [Dryococelus australis]